MSDSSTVAYQVSGMTCGHCVSAVTSELTALDGVSAVTVDLNPEGVSSVQVISDRPLERRVVAAAIDEAGYQLL
jgi:copper chaperone CopZ